MDKKFKGVISDDRWGTPSPTDYQLISKFISADVKAEDLFVYPVRLCDNAVDRDKEYFSENALNHLAELFVGKPGVFNHDWGEARDIHSRIYKAEVVIEEDYKYLEGWAYTTQEDVIKGIKEGLLKGVSIGFTPGETDKSDANGSTCIKEVTDVMEFSFVSVPCQPGACVLKNKSEGAIAMDLETQVKTLTAENSALKAELKALKLKSGLDSLFAKATPKSETARELACKVLEENGFIDEDGDLNVEEALEVLIDGYDYLFEAVEAEGKEEEVDAETEVKEDDTVEEVETDEVVEEVEEKEEEADDVEIDAIKSYLKAYKKSSNQSASLNFTHTSAETKCTKNQNAVIKSAGMTRLY